MVPAVMAEAEKSKNRGGTMRSEAEADRALERYADTVRRICMVHLKNHADTEDVFQNVFMKYILRSDVFENDEHEKAWLIRVTLNACKDHLKSLFRHRTVSLDEVIPPSVEMTQEHSEVLKAVLALPAKYKDPVYLFYFEGYSAVRIAEILGKNVNTIYTLLSRAKAMLQDALGGDDNG